jgi:aerobic-type carbon monoxide dehydrogenase small subunit (CoxS/CutS family)
MKKSIRLRVNGLARELEVPTRATLLETVRDQLGLTAAKLGCEMQVCGACTLLVDGKPVSACSYLAVDADGAEILTTEGLADGDKLHPLQEAFMDCGALQCGYCTSGFLLTAKALLDENPRPSEDKIRDYLAGNFCRCGCYGEIMQAVKKAAGL